MNDFSLSPRHERRLLTLLGVVCVGLLAGAMYLQLAKGEDPCPLCIIQRYFFALIAIFAFLGTGLRSRRSLAVIELLIVISALGGAAAAARHLQVQLHPGFSCGFDALQPIVDSLPPAQWLPSVFKVGGLCETVYPPILGILLPGWALIGFVLIAVLVGASLLRKRRPI
ncbi:disulfide bond formation protein B [Burkholderia glumae]|uniref:Disulfide bond formation protein B n=1 Tax=Burkholderia glumae TaxID=337 RepID=A0AAP9Y9S0_BURGL|nr:disulfide bond formation protein B [Burkholderia glumae]ACR28033.1 Disulfide bond formation protein DsbB [Burkholderia glumae BGR1]AJY67066.1 disulfide bond formation DsbB family protein [Burkholderia glumae LMG 2196 = ATCC 33617]KHJ64083.1 disulfide bond formation protein B [Burkholderia glumae]MCM2492328.1 disulfide bond formation protein B [Burkholderia glumae]MCM2537341.1 disulfide bond formation protein B [Burkholderia glumae]